MGNCFAAGIFLLVGIVHLLPDAQEAFDESLSPDSLPLAYVIAVGGYALMVFIENIMFPGHTHSHGPDHGHSEPKSQTVAENNNRMSMDLKKTKPLNVDFEVVSPPHECENADCPVASPPQKIHASALPGAILACALVVHSIFEGIACGLLDTKSSVITLCVAILIHNIPAALALAIKLQGVNKWISFLLMLAFITSSPLGIAVGISLSNLAYPAVEGAFLAISSGTFVYIGCTEIMGEEMAKPEIKGWKYFGFLVGYLPLALATIFIGG